MHVRAAKGVVRMWRTSGQELPSPFPDDASLAADKVCESEGERAKLALRNPGNLTPLSRQKVEAPLSPSLSLPRITVSGDCLDLWII